MGPRPPARTVTGLIPRRHGEMAWEWGSPGLLSLAWEGAKALAAAPFSPLRQEARRELGLPLDRPVIASGHQPLFVHPGILARELFLAALPKDVHQVWLSVDTDAPRELGFALPLLRRTYTFHRLVLVENYERRILAELPAPSGACLTKAWEKVESRLATLRNQSILLRAKAAWEGLAASEGRWPAWLESAKARLCGFRAICCLSVRALSETKAFRKFVHQLLARREEFLSAYEEATQMVRIPPLGKGQIPFWKLREGRRFPAQNEHGVLLPRALTLTLFARTVLCDFFLHGAGGAGYEPGVDHMFRAFFGVEPPPWGWLTGTFLLPEPSPQRRLPGREYPFLLHDLGEVKAALREPLQAL